MTVRLLVVCEAPADFRTATDLADRVFCERIDWLDESLLPTHLDDHIVPLLGRP